MQIENELKFTFDDVLLKVQSSNVKSRSDVDLSTKLTKNIPLQTPIVSSNMSTVTELEMMLTMGKMGGAGFLHRFMPFDKLQSIIEALQDCNGPVVISMGESQDWIDKIDHLLAVYPWISAVCLDVAHAHRSSVFKAVEQYHKLDYKQEIIVGNVCTGDAIRNLSNISDKIGAIKVGIGPSSVCSTRTATGHGAPQLSAIIECAQAAKEYGNMPIIADGGCSKGADVCKALAAGASTVMMGGYLAGTSASPGDIYQSGSGKYKIYRGSASLEDMKIQGKQRAPEGIAKTVPYKGQTIDVLNELYGHIRSGFSYTGAHNIEEFQSKAVFQRVTSNTVVENKTR